LWATKTEHVSYRPFALTVLRWLLDSGFLPEITDYERNVGKHTVWTNKQTAVCMYTVIKIWRGGGFNA
jgi:hypothetical protein